MRAHTKKHHTEQSPVSKKGNISASDYLNQTSDGRPWGSTSLAGLRYREDYTQKELGELIGVNQANISAMEREFAQ